MFILLIIFHLILGRVLGREVCYDGHGCFSDKPPWSGTPQRLRIPLPWTPEKINTRFFLLTRENPDEHQEFHARDLMNVKASLFLTSRKTCFIVHGLNDRAEDNWVPVLCREILLAEDVNCVGVDWHQGSGNLFQYPDATSNIRVVGAEMAYLLRRWQEELGYSPANVHIIGHSLGAQVAAEAGKRHLGIRRITGLDPARLHFENTPDEVSLDPSDAAFVDVIHTDTNPLIGLGIVKPVGHFDFYPNGGVHMTGCGNKFSSIANMNALIEAVACNHLRPLKYFTESVRNPRGFLSYPCSSYDMFTKGSCFPCPAGGCPSMGYYSEASYSITDRQTFYLNTGGINHFSSYRYKLYLSLCGECMISGQIFIALFGNGVRTTEYEVVQGNFLPGNTHFGFIDSDVKLDDVSSVNFRWTPLLLNFYCFQLGAERIELQAGEDGTISSFCTTGTVSKNVVQSLGPCKDRPVAYLCPNSGSQVEYL
ncbi:pancreatic lipase-related protein 2-like [Mixophyes fleayi]|uniref:pancreatic lipase-related protein 2-like n=1 Tax=Mixophyes fleayi TaxID=3061075 RepID=UPI003F4E0398